MYGNELSDGPNVHKHAVIGTEKETYLQFEIFVTRPAAVADLSHGVLGTFASLGCRPSESCSQ
jgi:hypothetical protein